MIPLVLLLSYNLSADRFVYDVGAGVFTYAAPSQLIRCSGVRSFTYVWPAGVRIEADGGCTSIDEIFSGGFQ